MQHAHTLTPDQGSPARDPAIHKGASVPCDANLAWSEQEGKKLGGLLLPCQSSDLERIPNVGTGAWIISIRGNHHVVISHNVAADDVCIKLTTDKQEPSPETTSY